MIVKLLLDHAKNLLKNERYAINLVEAKDKEEFYAKLEFKKIPDENCQE